MKLPQEKVKASRVNPRTLVLYSAPKMGKTTLLSLLEDNLIIDLESGSDMIDALKVKANNLKELTEVGKSIYEEKKPYKYVSIDTISKLEMLAEEEATRKYKQTIIGKGFTGDSVINLPMGAGYGLLRGEMKGWLDKLSTLADNIIFVGHLRDKFIIDKKGEEVSAKDIDLTGKLRNIVCAGADAIGYLFRKGNELWITFESKDELTCGSRCPHLRGQTFLIAESDDKGNIIKSYWNKIYQ